MTDESVMDTGAMAAKERPKGTLLLRAATDVFHEHGFHRAKVSDIARAAGVAQGTFYLYFASKEEVFLELLRRFGADLQGAALDFSWEGIQSLEELTRGLRHVLVSIFTVCARQRKAAVLFFGTAPAVSEAAAAIRQQFIIEAEQIVVGYLSDGIAAGHVRALDVEVVSRAIVGYVLHTITRSIIEEGRSEGLEELAEELLRFELYGILANRQGGL